jgi:hypothetical protein
MHRHRCLERGIWCFCFSTVLRIQKGGLAAALLIKVNILNLPANLTILEALHVIPIAFFIITVFLGPGISPIFVYAIADTALLIFAYLAFFHVAPHNSILRQSTSGDKFSLIILFPIATV